MAAYVGRNQRRFIDINSEEADLMQRKMFQYLKLLLPSTTIQTETSAFLRPRHDLEITTKDGFPSMPEVNEEIEQKKDNLEKLLRSYLNAQYSVYSL